MMRQLIFCFLSFIFSARQVSAQSTVINLFDGFSKNASLQKGWGLSLLIKHNDKTILFDGGSNANIFKHNVQQLKVDLEKVDVVVVSHSHHDHINGIDYLLTINPKVKIYFPDEPFYGATHIFNVSGQDSLVKDSLPKYMQYFDGTTTKIPVVQAGGRFWNADIEFVKESKEIMPGVRLVATSSPYMGSFSNYPGKSVIQDTVAKGKNDLKLTPLPELSLSIKTVDGEALFVGCSHTGVEKIAEEVVKETSNHISLLYGGFHMVPFDRNETTRIASYLKENLKVKKVAPAHCTGHLAFKILSDLYKTNYLYAGLGETISF